MKIPSFMDTAAAIATDVNHPAPSVGERVGFRATTSGAKVRRTTARSHGSRLLLSSNSRERALARAHVTAAPVEEQQPGRALSLVVPGQERRSWRPARSLA